MSVIEFLFSLPLWLLAVLLNVWLMGTAIVGLWIARRWILPKLKLGYEDATFSAAIVQSSMLLYGLIAALTAVGVWQRYSQVADIVSAEASGIAALWRDLESYPQPGHDAMRDLLRGYTEQIIRHAWPQQRQGLIPREGVEWMDKFQAELIRFVPANDSQKISHAETLRAFNQLIQMRRQRLDSVHAGLPWVMWCVLLPGAMGCVILCFFFQVANPRFHLIMLLGLSGFIAMVLFVIFALDRPLRGELAISSESYELIYDHHMRR